jgi:predicted Zn finger-like uncharacterized protein
LPGLQHALSQIDANKLGPDGRRVKCGKCAHVWFESARHWTSRRRSIRAEPVMRVTPLEPEEQSSIPVRNLPAVRQGAKGPQRTNRLDCLTRLCWRPFWRCSGLHASRSRGPYRRLEAVYAAVGIAAFPVARRRADRIEFDPKTEDGILSLLKGEIINDHQWCSRYVPGLRSGDHGRGK